MTVLVHPDALLDCLVGLRTHKRDRTVLPHDVCVRTRGDWPQEDFLRWLDAVCAQLNLGSDNQLASHLGIGHTLISGWRHGRQRPSIQTLNQIAQVLGEDPRRLWVLAGIFNPLDIGLMDESAAPSLQADLPSEIHDLIALFRDDSLAEVDREALRQHVAFLVAGVRAKLPDASDRTSRRRRAG